MNLKALVDALDAHVAKMQGTPRSPASGPNERRHLGASQIGKECSRALVYGFRAMTDVRFEGRILRLFARGHDEEPRVKEMLEFVGAKVTEIDPATGKQFRFVGYKGHFAGSSDGEVSNVPGLKQEFGVDPDIPILLEIKTHNLKWFNLLASTSNVKVSNPEHWWQMQTYMGARGLKGALYIGVCKDDDRWYCEYVPYEYTATILVNKKAAEVIDATVLPLRIMHASPSFHKCMFCDHRAACHFGAPAPKSCRSCKHSSAVQGQQWHCGKWDVIIPEERLLEGCPAWSQFTD